MDAAFILDSHKLQPGDIILTRDDHKLSKLVRFATAGDFSHAILYVGGSSYIDSTSDGVHARNLQRLLFQSESDCKVLRFKDILSTETIFSITTYARQLIGTRYSKMDAVRSGPIPNVSSKIRSNRQFCSRLVAQAYRSAGLMIVKSPDLASPEDINRSSHLTEVKDCLRAAKEEEIRFANDSDDNPLEKQIKITNSILREVRELSGVNVETFEEVVHLVVALPILDEGVTSIIEESGYLTMWQWEIDRNPWRYNYEVFVDQIQDENQQLTVASKEISRESGMRLQYQMMYDYHQNGYRRAPLRLHMIMVNLYRDLLAMSDVRTEVFTKVLIKTL